LISERVEKQIKDLQEKQAVEKEKVNIYLL
jgi:hypothetical protein